MRVLAFTFAFMLATPALALAPGTCDEHMKRLEVVTKTHDIVKAKLDAIEAALSGDEAKKAEAVARLAALTSKP